MSSGIVDKYAVMALDANDRLVAVIYIGVPWASGWPVDCVQITSAYYQTPTLSASVRSQLESVAAALIPAGQLRPSQYGTEAVKVLPSWQHGNLGVDPLPEFGECVRVCVERPISVRGTSATVYAEFGLDGEPVRFTGRHKTIDIVPAGDILGADDSVEADINRALWALPPLPTLPTLPH